MEWFQENLFTILTAIVAVYGAVLSTLVYRQSRSEKRRTLTVTLKWGLLTYGPGLGHSVSDNPHLILTVSNPGHIPVTLRSLHIRLPNGSNAVVPPAQGEVSLPHELPAGHSSTFWVDGWEFAQAAKQHGHSGQINLRAVATDAVGIEHLSDPYEFDIAEWGKPRSARAHSSP